MTGRSSNASDGVRQFALSASRFSMSVLARPGNLHSGTTKPGARVDPRATSGSPNDRVGYREPEPVPTGLVGAAPKTVEEQLTFCRWNAGSGVLDHKNDALADSANLDAHTAGFARVLACIVH
jgi:hypothetical protein